MSDQTRTMRSATLRRNEVDAARSKEIERWIGAALMLGVVVIILMVTLWPRH